MNEPLQVAHRAANEAAAALRMHFQNLSSLTMEIKGEGDRYDGIVTAADREAETIIVDSIRKTFPDHAFLAEEAHAQDAAAEQQEHLWVIDPLDGTNNFANGIEHYAVSVAYYRNGRAECGVVYRPESEDQFFAARGQGAWHRRRDGSLREATVNHHQKLADTMIGVGFYYDRGEMMRDTLHALEAFFQQQVHGIRRMGTAALDICQVGLGCFGGFFEYQLSPWDFAAARLFLEEAGGRITTCQNEPLPLKTSSVLASNGALHAAMLEIVAQQQA